jgi:CelD/BcsL family acetyltransferase involved in cellulose biosynthesis
VTTLRVHELTSVDALEGLAPEWSALVARSPGATPFQRPEWLLPWTRTFRPCWPRVLAVREGGHLVALAPLFLYLRDGERVLAPLGAGISDYLDVLVEDGRAGPALAALFAHLAADGSGWAALDLPDLSPASPLLRAPVPAGWDGPAVPHDACPVLTLPPPGGLAAAVPARQLARWRRARRRAARAGPLRLEVADAAGLDEALAALLRLHAARWSSLHQAGVLADPAVQAFHREAAPGLLRRGTLRLYTLRLGSEVAAALYALVEGSAAYCYLQGFDPAHAELSPGLLVVGEVLADLAGRGIRSVDFLRGREPYKHAWGACDRLTFRRELRPGRALAGPPGPAGAAGAAGAARAAPAAARPG